jgi:hypothetical protein
MNLNLTEIKKILEYPQDLSSKFFKYMHIDLQGEKDPFRD